MMREFFHGWRRKSGCVAMLMALMVLASWVRSRHIDDLMQFRIDDNRAEFFISSYHGLVWWRPSEAGLFSRTPPVLVSSSNARKGFDTTENAFLNCRIAHIRYDHRDPQRIGLILIRHGTIAIPLTLLSALLLLSKPRNSTAMKATEPTTGEGA